MRFDFHCMLMSELDDTWLPEDRLMAVFCASAQGLEAPELASGVSLLVGPAGSGRADRLLAAAKNSADWVFFHHAALGGQAHDPDVFLWRLLAALRRRCSFRDPLPLDQAVMREALPNWLARAAAQGSVAIVLADAENLSKGGLEPDLDWLPRHLPPGVRVGLSTRPGPSAELLRERVNRELDHTPEKPIAAERQRVRDVMDRPQPRRALELLWAARDGLSLDSIGSLGVHDPAAVLSALNDFVRSDGERWILAGTLVRELAASRDLADHGRRQHLHLELAQHQAGLGAPDSALIALWHLAAAGQQDQVIEQLASADWLAAMTRTAYRFDALRYWRRIGDRKHVMARFRELAEQDLPAAAGLGLLRLAFSLGGEAPPRAWLEQGLTRAILEGKEDLQAGFLEGLGNHADTPAEDRLKYLGEALQIRRRAADYQALTATLHAVAVRHEEAGDLDSAIANYRAGIGAIEQQCGPGSPELIAWLANLAGVYKARGALKEADGLIRRALKLAREQLGLKHPTTAGCCDQLAGVHYMSSQYETAEALYREALEITEAAFGPDHAATAACLNNLGTVVDARQRYGEAETLYRRALKIRLALHGEHHSDTASSLHNLATALEAAGKGDEAEQLFRRALDAWDKVSGQDSPAFATTLLGLADLLRDRGAWADAEPLYRSDIEIWRQLVGPEHPHTLTALCSLARLYSEGGKPELAEPLLAHVSERAAEVLGKSDALYLEAVALLAALLRDTQRKPEARTVLESALAAHAAPLAMLSPPAQKLKRLLDSLDAPQTPAH
ncbi:MAG: tetratricopeptide repeat protein [Wenzhouxiangella sp.]